MGEEITRNPAERIERTVLFVYRVSFEFSLFGAMLKLLSSKVARSCFLVRRLKQPRSRCDFFVVEKIGINVTNALKSLH